MKITIDTKEDSPEDIQKVMEILKHVVLKDSPVASNLRNEEEANTGFMNMFGDTTVSNNSSVSTNVSNPLAQSERATTSTKDTAPDFSAFLNLSKKQEEQLPKRSIPRVEFF